MSEKIRKQHLARKAVLYVRQSSPHQVARNEESRRLQYAMEDRLKELGWEEVEVVDEDLGRSAAGGTHRSGFEGMVAEVCLGKVGAVAAREVSRFARNSRDWQKLVEVCRVVDTLLIDQETIYDSRRGNDRLLLGLKGSLNEYELDILRLRAVEARHEKARRGELVVIRSAGYITTDEGIVKEPDRRVQRTIGLVFQKFLELGSARQTLLWFIEHGLEIPVREYGTTGWETVWKRLTYQLVIRILQDPIHAGAYTYGKTEVTTEFESGVARKKIRRKPKEEWLALLYDHHESYIAREEFERIQEMISNNAQWPNGPGPGAAKKGRALLSGLLRCGRCGRKLMVVYTGRNCDVARYMCGRGALNNAEARCISFGSQPVDDAVAGEVLRVIEPGAIEAAMLAQREVACEQDDVVEALRLDLEAARYTAERSWKQYDTADPANRLVVDELERRWNIALETFQELEDRITQQEAQRKQVVAPDLKVFEQLAEDLGRVWSDPETDVRLKKRIVRALIEEVIVDIDRTIGETSLVIHWKGGTHNELRVPIRRRGQNSLHTSKDIVDAVRTLTLVCTDDVVAAYLNRNGLLTGRGNRWTRERVVSLRNKRGIAKYSPRRQEAEGWMTLTQAAAYLGVSGSALRHRVERGELKAMHPLPDGPWVLNRQQLDQPGVRKVIERIRQNRNPASQSLEQRTLFETTT